METYFDVMEEVNVWAGRDFAEKLMNNKNVDSGGHQVDLLHAEWFTYGENQRR